MSIKAHVTILYLATPVTMIANISWSSRRKFIAYALILSLLRNHEEALVYVGPVATFGQALSYLRIVSFLVYAILSPIIHHTVTTLRYLCIAVCCSTSECQESFWALVNDTCVLRGIYYIETICFIWGYNFHSFLAWPMRSISSIVVGPL